MKFVSDLKPLVQAIGCRMVMKNSKRRFFLKGILDILQGVTRKKPDCINHALGTMPIGKPLAHRETQILSSIALQFRM